MLSILFKTPISAQQYRSEFIIVMDLTGAHFSLHLRRNITYAGTCVFLFVLAALVWLLFAFESVLQKRRTADDNERRYFSLPRELTSNKCPKSCQNRRVIIPNTVLVQRSAGKSSVDIDCSSATIRSLLTAMLYFMYSIPLFK